MLLVSCKNTSGPKMWIIAEVQMNEQILCWTAHAHTYWNPAVTGNLRDNYHWVPITIWPAWCCLQGHQGLLPIQGKGKKTHRFKGTVLWSCYSTLGTAASFLCTFLLWLFPLQSCHSEMLTGCQINPLENIRTLHASWFLKRTSSAVLRILQSSI